MGKIKITKEEIIDLYINQKKTLKEISLIAQCNLSNIYSHLNRMGIDRRNFSDAGRVYQLNENVFNKIDTEEKAYWLGFLFADGYNQETRGQIRLTLHKKDKEILEKFCKFLETDRPISELRNFFCDVSINSQIMSQDLTKLGCVQNKTLILKYPNIDESLQKHFIRGYFDGDGCLSVKNRKDRPSNTYQISLLGTYDMLNNIRDKFVKECGINKIKIHKRGKIYLLIYSGKTNFLKISKYLYFNSSIYLKRKYDIFNSTFTQ